MKHDTAILIIDVQMGMFSETDPVYKGNALLEKIRLLIAKARPYKIPVFYVQHHAGPGAPLEHGTPGWEIHPSIVPMEEDIIIQKRTPDSFYKTNLQQELESKGIKHLIITGIQSEVCVDTTCRRAFSLGYKVTLAQDAHSTWHTDHLTASQIIEHHNGVLRWFANVKESSEINFTYHFIKDTK
jgi:nicotinamidase-related amidase